MRGAGLSAATPEGAMAGGARGNRVLKRRVQGGAVTHIRRGLKGAETVDHVGICCGKSTCIGPDRGPRAGFALTTAGREKCWHALKKADHLGNRVGSRAWIGPLVKQCLDLIHLMPNRFQAIAPGADLIRCGHGRGREGKEKQDRQSVFQSFHNSVHQFAI